MGWGFTLNSVPVHTCLEHYPTPNATNMLPTRLSCCLSKTTGDILVYSRFVVPTVFRTSSWPKPTLAVHLSCLSARPPPGQARSRRASPRQFLQRLFFFPRSDPTGHATVGVTLRSYLPVTGAMPLLFLVATASRQPRPTSERPSGSLVSLATSSSEAGNDPLSSAFSCLVPGPQTSLPSRRERSCLCLVVDIIIIIVIRTLQLFSDHFTRQ